MEGKSHHKNSKRREGKSWRREGRRENENDPVQIGNNTSFLLLLSLFATKDEDEEKGKDDDGVSSSLS